MLIACQQINYGKTHKQAWGLNTFKGIRHEKH